MSITIGNPGPRPGQEPINRCFVVLVLSQATLRQLSNLRQVGDACGEICLVGTMNEEMMGSIGRADAEVEKNGASPGRALALAVKPSPLLSLICRLVTSALVWAPMLPITFHLWLYHLQLRHLSRQRSFLDATPTRTARSLTSRLPTTSSRHLSTFTAMFRGFSFNPSSQRPELQNRKLTLHATDGD
jgi:hypothetical protein